MSGDRESCATCQFWLEREAIEGLCRRFPPTRFNGMAGHHFPRTVPSDWCGEHQKAWAAEADRLPPPAPPCPQPLDRSRLG